MIHAQPAPAQHPAPTVAAVVVLAAGQGTRMRSSTPKVLHTLGGRSLVGHVLAAAEPLAAGTTVVVVGSGRDQVEEHLARIAPSALPVVQEEQLGSGHAAEVALAAVPDVEGSVLVVNGDSPLLTSRTLAALVAAHDAAGSVFTVLTAEVEDPTGLGRIVRDGEGRPRAIVEEKDATDEQRAIREVNAGVYVANAGTLRRVLAGIGSANAQGEQYLTDALAPLVAGGAPTAAVRADDPDDVLGCNDRVELAARRRTLNDRVLDHLMRSGVTVVDPLTTWVDVTVTVGRDAVIEPGTHLQGGTSVGDAAHVGPDTTLVDCTVADGATVVRSHCLGAAIGPGATVGPFSYLRPGTDLGPGAKVGAFVETKNVQVGEGSKVPHLSYVGDATIGTGSNIGAATVFVNYDGVAKHRTTIGDHVRVGSDTMLVAPVTVGDGAYTAAGSVITSDVPPGAMAVARAAQRNVAGWVRRRRPGSPAARAAEAAENRTGAPREESSGPSRADTDS